MPRPRLAGWWTRFSRLVASRWRCRRLVSRSDGQRYTPSARIHPTADTAGAPRDTPDVERAPAPTHGAPHDGVDEFDPGGGRELLRRLEGGALDEKGIPAEDALRWVANRHGLKVMPRS